MGWRPGDWTFVQRHSNKNQGVMLVSMSLFSKTTKIHLDIQGMTCGNCVKHVTEALESVAGVKRAKVDLERHEAEVEAKADTDVGRMIGAVEEAGYEATARA